ncbi:MAG: SapC family protein [Paraglaciecola sp.]|uniref:SapC family protein n=1 Tax=Paraglaciecola sp. TaxID=1920173 RepID=UPI00273F69AF|nr:SapC family protein [Paraglaciecola sp.]MDP5029746.1 SapC family protein [Paraglaciecola sp.]MDP5131636.1 SapC family protein [Paraglaciecola sp.]
MSNYVLLDPATHQDIKIKPHSNFAFSKHQHHASLVVHEFGAAASSFPVVYMKEPTQGQFRAVALLSLLAGENVFFTEQEWLAVHVPSAYLRQPFELGADPAKEKTLTIYIDEQSDYVSQSEGVALFQNGEASQFLQQVQNKMGEYYQQEQLTHQFTQKLLALNLLKEIELAIEFGDGKKTRVKGIYTVDEETLRQLPEAQVLELNTQNFLLPIHAILSSLIQVNRLIKQHNHRSENTILGVQMRVAAEE